MRRNGVSEAVHAEPGIQPGLPRIPLEQLCDPLIRQVSLPPRKQRRADWQSDLQVGLEQPSGVSQDGFFALLDKKCLLC